MNVEKIREMYPKGTQIFLDEMRGEPQMPYGLKGEVTHVDDIGQIHMRWENGSSLALNINEDNFEKISENEKISVILVEPGKYPKLVEIEDIDTGIIPKYAGCVTGAQWFKDRGQWADRSFEPAPGTIIFFDWEGDGITDHTGIVEKCENGTVHTIEGNSRDACRTKTYPVGSSVIYGYGIPAY